MIFIMRYTHIRQHNLNLLLSLQALVEERSISQAARRMYLSQPAMSRILDRLQQMFGDELLVRTLNGYEVTHRATQIYDELERLLPKVEELLRGDQFDPATAKETFKVAATDYGVIILLPELLRVLERVAPSIRVDLSSPEDEVFSKLEKSKLDLAFGGTEAALAPLHSEVLLQDEMVCLMRKSHPLGKRELTLKRYLDYKHIIISLTGGRQGVVEQSLDRLGNRRNVSLSVPYFGGVAAIVESTDLIATVPKRLAKRLSAPSRIRIAPAPMEFHDFKYVQTWHVRNDSDQAHKWFRDLVRETAARA
jgi:DNA-binding transcriptional LysR family regulator